VNQAQFQTLAALILLHAGVTVLSISGLFYVSVADVNPLKSQAPQLLIVCGIALLSLALFAMWKARETMYNQHGDMNTQNNY
jgi:multisubunit Na+/H+ antiporter MnhB subunit